MRKLKKFAMCHMNTDNMKDSEMHHFTNLVNKAIEDGYEPISEIKIIGKKVLMPMGIYDDELKLDFLTPDSHLGLNQEEKSTKESIHPGENKYLEMKLTDVKWGDVEEWALANKENGSFKKEYRVSEKDYNTICENFGFVTDKDHIKITTVAGNVFFRKKSFLD